jgi:hypothetical protein
MRSGISRLRAGMILACELLSRLLAVGAFVLRFRPRSNRDGAGERGALRLWRP